MCIVGDFNYKKINWKSWTSPGDEDTYEFAFIEGIRDCFLHQHIEEPTRRRGNDEPSLLDLVLTNEDTQVSNLKHRAPLGKSDHDVILFDFHCYLNYSSPKERFLWNKGNYDAMRENVTEEGWKDKFITASSQLINTNSSSRVEQCWDLLKTKLHELRDKYVPKVTVSNKPSWKDKGSFPIDKSAREAIKEKKKTWISATVSNRDKARKEFAKARNNRSGL